MQGSLLMSDNSFFQIIEDRVREQLQSDKSFLQIIEDRTRE